MIKMCLVIGDINIDIAIHSNHYPVEGGNANAENADFRLGGSGCITALSLQLLGQPTALAASMGDDTFSWFAREYINMAGLDADLIQVLPTEQTGYFVSVVTPNEQHTMFNNRGANVVALDEDRLLLKLEGCSHLHVSGYLLKGNEQYNVVKQLMEKAHSSGISVSLDPGICASKEAAERILGLLKYVDYFLPNQEELVSLVKEMEFEEKIETLLELGCKVVVLKLGREGGKYFKTGSAIAVQAKSDPKKKIVDTTGAGDCFNAGFLFGILNKKSPREALKIANAAALKIITSQHGIIDLINEAHLYPAN